MSTATKPTAEPPLRAINGLPAEHRAAARAQAPASAEAPKPAQKVAFPLMITKKMEADLKARGMTQADINKLTPQQAHDILNKPGAPKEVSVENPTKPQRVDSRGVRIVGPVLVGPEGKEVLAEGNFDKKGQQTHQEIAPAPPVPVVSPNPLAAENASLVCEPLVQAATKDLFRKNAFRITGLPVDATQRDIAKHSEKLKILAELGQDGQSQKPGLSLKPSSSVDEIREAIQKLKDPEKRLIDEFFWFWPEEFGESSSDAAMQALANGELEVASKIWMSRRNDSTRHVAATHNLALVAHVWALDWENYSLENDLGTNCRQQIADYWKTAFRRWDRIVTGEQLWETVVARIRQLNEPNLTTGFARRMRATLPLALHKINAELAVSLAAAGKIELARGQVQLIRDRNEQLAKGVEKTAELVLLPARNRLKEQICRAKERTNKNPKDGINAARDLLGQARYAFDLFDLFFSNDSDFRNDMFDEVVGASNELQVVYHNATGDNDACLNFLKSVLSLAKSPELRQRIAKNIVTLISLKKTESVYAALKTIQDSSDHPRVRLDKFQETVVPIIYGAADLASDSDSANELFDVAAIILRGISLEAWNKYKDRNTAVAAHQSAIKFARGTELKQRLAEDQKTLHEMGPAAGLTPISATPSLSTMNRCGKALALLIGGVVLAIFILGALNSGNSPSSSSPSSPTASTEASPYEKSTQSQDQPTVPASITQPTIAAVEKGTLCTVKIPANGTMSVHAGATANSTIVATLKNGDHVYLDAGDAIETTSAWRKVTTFAGVSGWVSTGFAPTTTDEIGRTPSSPDYAGTPSVFTGKTTGYGASASTYRVPSSAANGLDLERAAVDSERAALEALESQISSLSREIESERVYLDQTNPYAVQQFNSKVDSYNALLRQDKGATAAFNQKVDNYNAKLRQYSH